MARDKVKRNVVLLCSVPTGRPGRPSKSLTTDQARDVLTKTAGDWMHNYIVVSLLTGARTEELRALQWQHVHLEGMPHASPPIPAYVEVWRSVRAGGDTKTRRSRRTLALPSRAVEALRRQRVEQAELRLQAGERWTDHGLVFPSKVGTPMDRNNALRAFRSALVKVPGLDPAEWSPRELRHSFVSLLSDSGVSLEEISRLVGHSGTSVTELVYRHQIRPVLQTGAVAMDSLFGTGDAER
nr:site-specific integrase [Terrabacter sp. MAHUQ-38]